MKCMVCGESGFKDLRELADHIIDDTTKHSDNSGAVDWATRYLGKEKKYQKESKEPICCFCHKPIGKQNSNHCYC